MKMPESIKPLGLLEHSTRKKDGKPVRPLKGIRNSRLDEIRGGMAAANGFKSNKNDASRTLQPTKAFDLQAALELEKQKKEEEAKHPDKKVATIQIFKTHRHFSDIKADDLHRDLSDLD